MENRITIHTLPFGDTTDEGRYYAKVDNENIGMDGRTHWQTYEAAMVCARRFVMNSVNRATPTGENDEP